MSTSPLLNLLYLTGLGSLSLLLDTFDWLPFIDFKFTGILSTKDGRKFTERYSLGRIQTMCQMNGFF